MELTFEAIAEDSPGPKWRALFDRFWPAYERWFLSDGDHARPRYLSSLRALREHMPELVPTYERLVELAGNTDLIARFMSLFCPPSYLIRCSQAVWSDDAPFLVRNYDYNPQLYEGVILKTAWNGRAVISMNDDFDLTTRANNWIKGLKSYYYGRPIEAVQQPAAPAEGAFKIL